MDSTSARRVRLACDSCHNMKMKCSGGRPCMTCTRYRHTCIYSAPNRIGRPKGSKNKTVSPPSTTDSSSCAGISQDSELSEAWNWNLPQSPLLTGGNFEIPTTTRPDEFSFRSPLATLSDQDLHTNLSSSAPAFLARTYLVESGGTSSSAAPVCPTAASSLMRIPDLEYEKPLTRTCFSLPRITYRRSQKKSFRHSLRLSHRTRSYSLSPMLQE